MAILEEIKRRKVFQVTAVYAVVAWLIVQVVGAVNEPLSLPDWLDTVVIVLLLVGFPIALILAWAFDITPQGIKRDSSSSASSVTQPQRPNWPTYLTHGLVLIAVGFLLLDRYVLTADTRLDEISGGMAAQQRANMPQPGKPVQFVVDMPQGAALAVDTNYPVLELSPDGSKLVFVAEEDGTRRLYLRDFAESEAQRIPGTDGAVAPFFSPDGDWIAFFSDDALMRVRSSGVGAPTTLRTQYVPAVMRGAVWTELGSIVVGSGPNSGLHEFRVADDSEEMTLTSMPSAWPDTSPEGILFVDNSSSRGRVSLLVRDTQEVKPLVNESTTPRYSPTGHVLYAREGTLYAARFGDIDAEPIGPEHRLAENIVTGSYGAAQFAVSDEATLAYISGPSSIAEYELVWVNREGKAETLFEDGRQFFHPRLSPDGTSLAVMSYTGSNSDVWVLNLERGNLTRWTTHPGEDFGPVWSPDGRLAFSSEIGQDFGELGPGMAWMEGPSRPPERLLESPGDGNWDFPTSWSADGRSLLFALRRNRSPSDIYLFDTESREIEPFLETPFTETAARFSPNGEWIAYVSDQTERREVYLRRFDGGGDAIQISTDGGTEPIWSRTGAELYYREGSKLMAVELGEDPRYSAGVPRALFEGDYEETIFGGENANYDVSPDGRFVMIRRKNQPMLTAIDIVFNWPDTFAVP